MHAANSAYIYAEGGQATMYMYHFEEGQATSAVTMHVHSKAEAANNSS